MHASFIGVAVVTAVRAEKDNKPGYNVAGLPSSGGKTVWVEKGEFDHYHASMTALPFGLAMESLRRGCCIYRACWPAGTYLHMLLGDGVRRPRRYVSRSVLLKTCRQERQWSPSSEEMLAVDWAIGINQPLT